MPKLVPIQAVTYNTKQKHDVSTRIAPPYDVLDEQPKQNLLQRDPHNVVAIDLPVTPPKTVGPDEKYEEAGDTFRNWLEENVLIRQEKPAIYAYEQVYTVEGKQLSRRGLIAALGVEPFNRKGGGIFRHEMTIAGGVNDRYKLMETTKAQLSPIFGIFSDPEGEVAGRLTQFFDAAEPDFEGTTDDDQVVHRCWRVEEQEVISALQYFFVMTDVFIADGHHRYTTAMKFAEDHPDLQSAESCMFVLVAAEDPGMIVLPYHRVLIGLNGLTPERLQAAVEENDALQIEKTNYNLDEMNALAQSLPQHEHHAMGLQIPGEDKLWMLTCTGKDPLAATNPDKPEVWRMLDVAILQHLVVEQVLEPAFGDPANNVKLNYKYTASLKTLRELTETEDDAGSRLGVIVQPTPLESVMGVSREDEVMPPKSTYFYPKLATGLVINTLD